MVETEKFPQTSGQLIDRLCDLGDAPMLILSDKNERLRILSLDHTGGGIRMRLNKWDTNKQQSPSGWEPDNNMI